MLGIKYFNEKKVIIIKSKKISELILKIDLEIPIWTHNV